MNKLAVIPARGGSKRIPRKNIRNFAGKPIIAYAIEAAIASDSFDEVIVSTDDYEIGKIAVNYGASVPFLRSSKNSNDHATIAQVLLEVMEQYQSYEGKELDIIGCLFATAPFIRKNWIEELMLKVEHHDFDSAFTIQRFDYPILRALRKNERDNLEMIWPENLNVRSQDLEESYHDAGQVYIAKARQFIEEKTFFMKNSFGLELSRKAAWDIDTIEDWEFAEQLFSYQSHPK